MEEWEKELTHFKKDGMKSKKPEDKKAEKYINDDTTKLIKNAKEEKAKE